MNEPQNNSGADDIGVQHGSLTSANNSGNNTNILNKEGVATDPNAAADMVADVQEEAAAPPVGATPTLRTQVTDKMAASPIASGTNAGTTPASPSIHADGDASPATLAKREAMVKNWVGEGDALKAAPGFVAAIRAGRCDQPGDGNSGAVLPSATMPIISSTFQSKGNDASTPTKVVTGDVYANRSPSTEIGAASPGTYHAVASPSSTTPSAGANDHCWDPRDPAFSTFCQVFYDKFQILPEQNMPGIKFCYAMYKRYGTLISSPTMDLNLGENRNQASLVDSNHDNVPNPASLSRTNLSGKRHGATGTADARALRPKKLKKGDDLGKTPALTTKDSGTVVLIDVPDDADAIAKLTEMCNTDTPSPYQPMLEDLGQDHHKLEKLFEILPPEMLENFVKNDPKNTNVQLVLQLLKSHNDFFGMGDKEMDLFGNLLFQVYSLKYKSMKEAWDQSKRLARNATQKTPQNIKSNIKREPKSSPTKPQTIATPNPVQRQKYSTHAHLKYFDTDDDIKAWNDTHDKDNLKALSAIPKTATIHFVSNQLKFGKKKGTKVAAPLMKWAVKDDTLSMLGMTFVQNSSVSKKVTSVFMQNELMTSGAFTRPDTTVNFPGVSVYTSSKKGAAVVGYEQFWPNSWYETPDYIQNGMEKATKREHLGWPSCQSFHIVNTHLDRDILCVNNEHDEGVACGTMLEVGNIVMSYGNDVHWVKECWYVGVYLVVDGGTRLGCKVGVVKAAYNQLHIWTNRVGVVKEVFASGDGRSREMKDMAFGYAIVTCLDGTMCNMSTTAMHNISPPKPLKKKEDASDDMKKCESDSDYESE